ncbi:CapA family protein (plasmid) [Cupriavidus metallidurans]|uniref:CapA family protein n=1 Tax=Cupriavidus metallidurans TaxID=119219 RepID=UPI003D7216AB
MKALLTLAAVAALTAPHAWAGEGTARVAFVGDVMLAESERTGRFAAHGGDPFAHVRGMLANADLRVANFESSAGTTGTPDRDKPYSFRTAQSALAGFASVFVAAGLANNHAGDFGRKDFVQTIEALRKAGSTTFGGGKDARDAHRAAMFERNGVKIALLGYLDFQPRWFAAAPGMPGVAWLDENQAALDIAQAKADGADVVVVIPHWGVEHEPKADYRQQRMARALLDSGADAVIGGHPHVAQDYEVYKGKPIVYSLGNFVFDGFDDEDNVTGWAVFADFDKKGVTSLSTRVVRMDTDGLPSPDSDSTRHGPCWKRGEKQMWVCQ